MDLENEYLKYTKDVLDSEISKFKADEDSLKKESLKLTFEDRFRGSYFHLNAKLLNVGGTIDSYKKAKDNPYFGRIDYQDKGTPNAEKIYIGRVGISTDGKNVVYDWRSPICSLYYDSEVGPVSYNSPAGIQNGDLLLKRQIIIKDGKLINAVDSNLVTDDELLLPYLDVNTNNKMKTIIASIQKEQNAIIRADDNNIIVQGVAGSGKTSVALHRIAYLLYSNSEKRNSSNFLILGPNKYFLNYISTVLPELDTTPVEQKTILELMNEYVGLDLSLSDNTIYNAKEKQNAQKRISAFKGSLEYRDLLDKFINDCFNGKGIVNSDFMINGKTVYTAKEIIERMLSSNDGFLNFENTYRYFKSKFKEDKSTIFGQLNKEYREVYTSLPKGDPLRKEAVEKSIELEKSINENGEKLLDRYFKSMNKSCLSLYVSFINELSSNNTGLFDSDIALLQKDTLKAIRKKQIPYEDIAALIYLNFKLTNKKLPYKNIVIDEAQDYSLFAYYALKNIFTGAKFNIYGDLAQSIYSYRSVKNWDEVSDKVFGNNCDKLQLSKSYRTTTEITNVANEVLSQLDLTLADPVIRHGEEVEFSNNDGSYNIGDKINEWINSGYKTVAIICKDEAEAEALSKDLTNKGIACRYISNADSKYDGNIFVMSVPSSKGLEFDCVIVNDASKKEYDINNDVDMHLLYVACTRALHQLSVLYNDKVVPVFDGLVNNKDNNMSLTRKKK